MRAAVVALVLGALSLTHAGEPAKEFDAIQGEWNVVEMVYNGKDLAQRYKLNFIFKGDTAMVEGDGAVKKEYAKLKFKFVAGTMPRCVDLTVAGGAQDDAKMEAIYDRKESELRLCVRVFALDRPSSFEAPAGSNNAYLRLKKVK